MIIKYQKGIDKYGNLCYTLITVKHWKIKGGLIMNKRINYRWYSNYMENQYSEELDSIVTDGVYDFEDWIRDNVYRAYNGNFSVERDGDCYYILDGCNERTGEMYQVISEETTEEEVR